MLFDLWGVSGTIGIAAPDTPSGYVLLLLYVAAFGYFVFRYQGDFARLSHRWAPVLALALASFVLSQLFPIHIPINGAIAPVALTVFAFVPLLFAGAVFGPAAALLVSFAAGMGQSLGESHTFFDPFHYAFAATAVSVLMNQRFQGRFYRLLRMPVVAGVGAGAILALLAGLTAFISMGFNDSLLSALDVALLAMRINFWPLIIEGAVGGAMVILILVGVPQLQTTRPLIPSPEESSLRRRLLNNFVGFAVLLTIFVAIIVFTLSIFISTRLVINQMAHDAQTVSAKIPDFQAHLQSLLMQYSQNEDLLNADPALSEKTLQQLFRSSPVYRRILLVDSKQNVSAFYPSDVEFVELTELETTAVTGALTTSIPDIALADTADDEHIVSFVAPVLDENGAAEAVLVGRVPQLPLQDLIVGLQGTVGEGTGFIVDDNRRIVAHPDGDQLLAEWQPPENSAQIRMTGSANAGTAVQVYAENNQHLLLYYLPAAEHGWTVVVVAPYEAALQLALSIGAPLLLALFVIMGAFYVNLTIIGRDITQPIGDLAQASKTIAAGGKWRPPESVNRQDEIGQLTQAFSEMYQSRNKRLTELALLLNVSQEVSNNVNLRRGMTAILRGALRGTGASGARAVVVNPSGNQPLTFGEGPAAGAMAALDLRLMRELRHEKTCVLTAPAQIQSGLELKTKPPVAALVAVALISKNRFVGVLWLGYRQAKNLDETAQNLLKTLSGQTAVLVENAHLFATAEGGRRRLAAVLASTTDAVIVIDQTNRVLLVNRAMESIFGLQTNRAIGRPISTVVDIPELTAALLGKNGRTRNLEIPLENGQTFYANISAIISNEGQQLGRVAVLHDITHLKEIDELKTDFVATVSHDLRGPLTYMLGYITMLPMVGELNDEQQKYVDKTLSGVKQMTQLIEDLLDLGRIEAGIDLRYEPINLKDLLTDIASEHWQHAYSSGIKLSVDLADDVAAISGDTALIRQAVTNYVTNSIKYAPDSGAMVLGAEMADDAVVIRVQDNGPGIPQKDQMRLFEKFYRVDRNDGRKVKGSGLGLALVRSIAERHGGRVWCQSEVGEGSSFYMALPLDGGR